MRFYQNIINISLGNGGVGFLLFGLLFFWVIVIGMDIVGSFIAMTWGAVYGAIFSHLSIETVDELIAEVDTNKDGVVDFVEYFQERDGTVPSGKLSQCASFLRRLKLSIS